MKKYGLIGYPLGHSFSPDYFRQKFAGEGHPDFTYALLPIREIELVMPLLHDDYSGLNVTIPYKTAVMSYLNDLDPVAFAVGAVNTLVRTGDNSWKGYNTDVTGFKVSLQHWFNGHVAPMQALVLGTGGASKAVRFALSELGIRHHTVSRGDRGYFRYAELNQAVLDEHLLVINTTPLGMAPAADTCPDIPYSGLTPAHWLFDLVYNPVNTLFLTRGAAAGAKTKNGLEMLHLQADHAWAIWKAYGKF